MSVWDSYPVCMYEVLQFMRDQDHSPFVILQKLEDSFLHQVITEVDVQRWEGIVLPDTRQTDAQ